MRYDRKHTGYMQACKKELEQQHQRRLTREFRDRLLGDVTTMPQWNTPKIPTLWWTDDMARVEFEVVYSACKS